MKLLYPHILRRSPEMMERARRCRTQAQVDRLAARHAVKKGRKNPAKFQEPPLRSAFRNGVRDSMYGGGWDRRKTPPAKHLNRGG